MALSLGVHKGTVLRVGGDLVRVAALGPGVRAVLEVQGKAGQFLVTEDQRTEVVPKVYVSFGRNSNNNPSPRLCFEAPREISITRV